MPPTKAANERSADSLAHMLADPFERHVLRDPARPERLRLVACAGPARPRPGFVARDAAEVGSRFGGGPSVVGVVGDVGRDPEFSARGHGAGEGANLNLPLQPGQGDDAFLAATQRGLDAIAASGALAVVLSLGFDAHVRDPLGALTVTTDAFRRIGEMLRATGLPMVAVQEGGYAIEEIGGCLDAFLSGYGDTAS